MSHPGAAGSFDADSTSYTQESSFRQNEVVSDGFRTSIRVRAWPSGREFILTYDGIPSYAVSIMEFRERLVASETQYFGNRFDPAPSRAHLVERAGEIKSF